jgi:hypothetical protein
MSDAAEYEYVPPEGFELCDDADCELLHVHGAPGHGPRERAVGGGW